MYVSVGMLGDSRILKYLPTDVSVICLVYNLAVASGLSLFSFSFSQAESLEDKNMANVHRCQVEKLKSQCDRLTQELTQNENENKKLKLKYQCLKDQLEEKVKI